MLASVYLDIPTNSRWAPYVGGGLGYQAKVGLSYLANKKTDIFVEGVYQGSSGFEENSIDYSSVNMWGARLGARFRFWKNALTAYLGKNLQFYKLFLGN